MKTYRIALLCLLLALASPSIGSALHTFTTTDGRTLKATVLAYNAGNKKIQIEREDGKKIWTLPSVFSEPDKEYIQQWIAADQFMLPSKFKIKGSTYKDRISEETTEIIYEITLENRTDFPLKDLKIEYRSFILHKLLNKHPGNQKDSTRVSGGQLLIAKIPAGKSSLKTTQPIVLRTMFENKVEVGYFATDYYKLKTSRKRVSPPNSLF